MSEDFEKCPFCGERHEIFMDGQWVQFVCIPNVKNGAAWFNTRPIEDALRADLVGKQNGLEYLRGIIATLRSTLAEREAEIERLKAMVDNEVEAQERYRDLLTGYPVGDTAKPVTIPDEPKRPDSADDEFTQIQDAAAFDAENFDKKWTGIASVSINGTSLAPGTKPTTIQEAIRKVAQKHERDPE